MNSLVVDEKVRRKMAFRHFVSYCFKSDYDEASGGAMIYSSAVGGGVIGIIMANLVMPSLLMGIVGAGVGAVALSSFFASRLWKDSKNKVLDYRGGTNLALFVSRIEKLDYPALQRNAFVLKRDSLTVELRREIWDETHIKFCITIHGEHETVKAFKGRFVQGKYASYPVVDQRDYDVTDAQVQIFYGLLCEAINGWAAVRAEKMLKNDIGSTKSHLIACQEADDSGMGNLAALFWKAGTYCAPLLDGEQACLKIAKVISDKEKASPALNGLISYIAPRMTSLIQDYIEKAEGGVSGLDDIEAELLICRDIFISQAYELNKEGVELLKKEARELHLTVNGPKAD